MPKWIWARLGKIEIELFQSERDAKERFKAGKLSSGELRIEQKIDHSYAEERSKFREWVLDSATIEGDAATGTPRPR